MMMPTFLRPLALAAALALAPAVAGAFTVSYQNSQNVFGGTGSAGTGGNGRAPVTINSVTDPDVGPINVQAGGFALKGNLFGNGVENFTAFCLDIATTMKNNKNYEVTTNPFPPPNQLTPTQIANIGKLFNTAYGIAGLLTDNAKSAGFQLALWEIIYETAPTFVLLGSAPGSGNFTASVFNGQTVSADAIAAGQGFLNGLNGATVGKGWNLTFLESLDGNNDNKNDSQHLVTATPVPLPAAGLMLLAALGGLGLMRRRRAA